MSDLDRLLNYVRRMAWIECAYQAVKQKAITDRDIPGLSARTAQRERIHAQAKRTYLTHA